MFGGEITMMPEVPGNRMGSDIDTNKMRALGWTATRALPDYIRECQ